MLLSPWPAAEILADQRDEDDERQRGNAHQDEEVPLDAGDRGGDPRAVGERRADRDGREEKRGDEHGQPQCLVR
jgi:hypothetical protein